MRESHTLPMGFPSVGPDARAELQKAKRWTRAALVLYAFFGILFLAVFAVTENIFMLGMGLVPLVYLVIVYYVLYTSIVKGRIKVARTRALALGIISLFVGGIISGILLLVAFIKLDRADGLIRPAMPIRRALEPPTAPPQPAVIPQPEEARRKEAEAHPRYCPSCGQVLQPPYRFCTNCGARVG